MLTATTCVSLPLHIQFTGLYLVNDPNRTRTGAVPIAHAPRLDAKGHPVLPARTLHGALMDAELLAEVYINMTRGQDALLIDAGSGSDGGEGGGTVIEAIDYSQFNLPVVGPTEEEAAAFIKANVTGPGTIKFAWKVSSQTNSDHFLFKIGATEQARISGEVDWEWRTFNLTANADTSRTQNATILIKFEPFMPPPRGRSQMTHCTYLDIP